MPLSIEKISENAVMYQNSGFHKLGTDSVLLSEFAPVKKNQLVCDLGAGQGALSLLLFLREPSLKIHGIELLPDAAELCFLNMMRNGFYDSFNIHVGDMRALRFENQGRFDLAVSNPPYFKSGSGKKSPAETRHISRCDDFCTVDDLCRTAARTVKYGGLFSVVYVADRFCDMICSMRKHKLEPKIMRFVHKDFTSPPSLVLITARLGGAPDVKILPPLFTRNTLP